MEKKQKGEQREQAFKHINNFLTFIQSVKKGLTKLQIVSIQRKSIQLEIMWIYAIKINRKCRCTCIYVAFFFLYLLSMTDK